MPIDASIALGIKPVQIESPLNALSQVMQVQGLQSKNALAQYTLNKSQRTDDDMNALMRHIANGGDLTTPEGQAAAFKVAPISAPAMIEQQLKQRKTLSDIDQSKATSAHLGAQTADQQLKTRIAKSDQAIKDIAGFQSPQEALASLQAHEASGDIDPQKAAMVRATIPQDPTQFPKWQLGMLKSIMAAKDQMALTVPDANSVLTNQTHIQTTGMTNATSRANNRDTIAAENVRAGVMPGGGMDDNSERTAQAIASGQLPAPTGMALLNPKNQRILGRVMEINPQYDATTVSAKKTAAAAFTSGPLGNALRSVSTANAHLDQLGELADALGNGNTQVVNKVQNYFSKATGNPAVTNFDAIKAIVGQEVVKAIVAGGGGVGEREEAAKIFSTASSPAQLKGAIQHYRMVMGAQANNLLEQRRAAGLPDSTLPNYSVTNPSGGAPAAPAGWKIEKVN